MNKKSIFLIILLSLPLILAGPPGPPPIMASSSGNYYMDLGQVLTLRYEGEFCSRYELHLVMYDDNHPYFFLYKGTGYGCSGWSSVTFINTIQYGDTFKVDPLDVNSTEIVFDKHMGSFGKMSFEATVNDVSGNLSYVGVKTLNLKEIEMETDEKFQITFTGTVYDVTLKEVNPDKTAVKLEISKNGETLTSSFALNVTQSCIEFAKDSKRMILAKYRLYEERIIFVIQYEDGISVKKGGTTPPPSSKSLLDWEGVQKINNDEYLIVEAPYQSTKVPKILKFTYDGTETLYYVNVRWINPNSDYATDPIINTNTISPIAASGTVSFDCRFADADIVWHIQTLQVYQELPGGDEIVSEIVIYFHRSDPSYTLLLDAPEQNYTGEKWIFSLKIGDELVDSSLISRIEVNNDPQNVANPFEYVPTEGGSKKIEFVIGTKTISKTISVTTKPYTPNYTIQASPNNPKINTLITITLKDLEENPIDINEVSSFTISGAGISESLSKITTATVRPSQEGTISINAVIKGITLQEKRITVEKPEIDAEILVSSSEKSITIIPDTPSDISVSIDGDSKGTISDREVYYVDYGNHKVLLTASGYKDYDVTKTIAESSGKKKMTISIKKTNGGFEIEIDDPAGGVDSTTVLYSKSSDGNYDEEIDRSDFLNNPKAGYYEITFKKEEYEDEIVYRSIPKGESLFSLRNLLIVLGIAGIGIGVLLGGKWYRGRGRKGEKKPVKTKPTGEKEEKKGSTFEG